jgi:hypothetical protein
MRKPPVNKNAPAQKEIAEGVRHEQPAGVEAKPCKAKDVGHRRCDCGRLGCGNQG